MADKPADAAPPKSKKLLLIVGLLVVVLAVAGGGAWFFISKQRAALDEGEPETVSPSESASPPTYLPLDNMVVNLSDPGGEKVAQIGITLVLADAKAVEKVKQYLPTIRSGVLLLVSQRTAEELLQREGKVKLAGDILKEAARPFGGVDDEAQAEPENAAAGAKKPKVVKKKPLAEPLVKGVLFSSFIVQ